jgi:beta-fructofuranosidase
MTKKTDLYKPNYHIFPQRGWLNDPCGCSFFNNEYHVFYQYHIDPVPFGLGSWFHLKSKDLTYWEELPIALEIEHDYEANGCWTGSAIEYQGQHILYYTSNKDGRVPQGQVCRAMSSDGKKYTKDPNNPLIRQNTNAGHKEMRDPKVWVKDGTYYMIQGTNRDGKGEIIVFISRDGIIWEYQGVFFNSEKWMGNMFECPDFFSINGTDFLIFSPMNWLGHKNVILRGHLDLERLSFTAGAVQDLDYGSDFYAAQTMSLPDGRVVVLGWMSAWGKPQPSAQFGWAGMLTIPREINVDNDGIVIQKPIRELDRLLTDFKVRNDIRLCNTILEDKILSGQSKKIAFSLDWEKSNCARLAINLRGALFLLDFESKFVTIDKTSNLNDDNTVQSIGYPFNKNRTLSTEILIDRSNVELFIDGGRAVISERIYPSPDQIMNTITAIDGTAYITDLHIGDFRSIY